MYDGQLCTVELKCENSMMKDIIDRFGEDVQTKAFDYKHFTATVEVSVSPPSTLGYLQTAKRWKFSCRRLSEKNTPNG